MSQLPLLVADVAVVLGSSIAVGAVAPRWPQRWLERDPWPLHLLPWETLRFYRRLGIARMTRRLPELGTVFGGLSKARLPGTGLPVLLAYLRDVRRGEWVHWLSITASVVLFAFNPWWLALTFAVAVAVV